MTNCDRTHNSNNKAKKFYVTYLANIKLTNKSNNYIASKHWLIIVVITAPAQTPRLEKMFPQKAACCRVLLLARVPSCGCVWPGLDLGFCC